MSKTYYFAFTLNNYTEEQVETIKTFIANKCYRGMIGFEIAPTTGTPHLQGCFQTKDRVRRTTVKNQIGIKGFHVEEQKKHYIVNANYCSKTSNAWFYPDKEMNFNEDGSVNTKRNKKYDNAVELAKKGYFDKIDPEIYLKYDTKLKKIHEM